MDNIPVKHLLLYFFLLFVICQRGMKVLKIIVKKSQCMMLTLYLLSNCSHTVLIVALMFLSNLA